MQFPRLIGRGPIEALVHRVARFCEIEFPRLIGRGPIEASGCLPPLIDSPKFPRLIGRGPIEAWFFHAGACIGQAVSTSDWTWPH